MKEKLTFNNTYESGSARVFVMKEDDSFVGVCLEFGLVIREDSLQKAQEVIKDLTEAHIENVLKNKLSEKLLNRSAPQKYWDIYEHIISQEEKLVKSKEVATNPPIYSYSRQNYTKQALLSV